MSRQQDAFLRGTRRIIRQINNNLDEDTSALHPSTVEPLAGAEADTADNLAAQVRACLDEVQEMLDTDAPLYVATQQYRATFEEKFAELKQQIDDLNLSESDMDDPSMTEQADLAMIGEPNLDDRARLAADLFLLSGPELQHVMGIVEESCPECIDRDGKRMELLIDDLPVPVFQQITAFAIAKASMHRRNTADQKSHKRKR